jgi:RHS repeat-associated protein
VTFPPGGGAATDGAAAGGQGTPPDTATPAGGQADPLGPGAPQPSGPLALPTITFPKGGGAIRGVNEKLDVDLATGAASLSVPLPATPGRQQFGPELSLRYGSGGGNGPFGLGWHVSSPSITRKTSVGLPRYEDGNDSDVFVLSDAEDLAPLLELQGADWVLREGPDPTGNYTVRGYRPRVEAGFARIERWTAVATGDVHWRTVSKNNVTSLFGQDATSRISDPADAGRIFSWLIDLSYDDRGNAISWGYKAEDAVNVTPAAHEQGRVVTANRYLKSVRYGTTSPYLSAVDPAVPASWYFEMVFDYGEHDLLDPQLAEPNTWPSRADAFSSYRSCFEIRTYRLCRRVLMFHRFPDGLDASAKLVRSLDLAYSTDQPGDPALPTYALLTSITERGYIAPAAGGDPVPLARPPLTLTYAALALGDVVEVADADALANQPAGVDGRSGRFVDLDGEGLQGILSEDDAAWYYRRNISAAPPQPAAPPVARFEPLSAVATKPAGARAATALQLVDLHGDGHLCAVDFQPPTPGYFARGDDGDWLPFRAFPTTAAVDWSSTNLRSVDLDGDGLSDVLLTEDGAFSWFPFLAEDGFGPSERVVTPRNEDAGPALVLDEGDSSVFLADMSGDGLSDLVRVRNGDVCYWPNLGYGRFGTKVVMDGAPWFDPPDDFNARRVRLADVDGTGVADLVYLGTRGVSIWLNESGNRYTAVTPLGFPCVDDISTVDTRDLLGTGTSCLVWSSPLPGDQGRQLRYVQLTGGVKPHLLTGVANGIGAETTITWSTSTRFYVEDLLAGAPWATRLAFPVHVVAQRRVADIVSGTAVTSSYRYRHGYFDGVEREFRGFARVDQTDTDQVPAASGIGTFTETPPSAGGDFALPPVNTRSFIHTGAYVNGDDIAAALATEYYQGDPEAPLLGQILFVGEATPEEMREACRALRGKVLRTETFARDGTGSAADPYRVVEHRYQVSLLQPPSGPSYASVYACNLESLTLNYERNAADPRLGHDLVLEVDPYGAVTKSASAAYPRRAAAFPEQDVTLVTYVEHDVANADGQPDWYRVGVPVETRTYELTGVKPAAPGALLDVATLAKAAPAMPQISSGSTGSGAIEQKRLIKREQIRYRADDLSGALPIGQVDSLALVDHSYRLVMTPDMVASVYSSRDTVAAVNTAATTTGGLVDLLADGSWWAPSAARFYSPAGTVAGRPVAPAPDDPNYAAQHFYLPQGQVDAFGKVAAVSWELDMCVATATDALGNTTSASTNFRVLQPWLITDPNQNRSGVRYDQLGQVVAAAAMGKATGGGGDEGDHLDLTNDEASPTDSPTTTYDYDLTAFSAWLADPAHDPAHPQPVYSHCRARVTHRDPVTAWIESYVYSDGFGRVALTKRQAEPGPAPMRAADGSLVLVGGALQVAPTDSRWVGSGQVVYDNKANPVKAYEPFFDSSPVFTDEIDLVQFGVTAITTYDPLSRVVRVDNPNGTYRMVEFDPWVSKTSDEVDTVLGSAWYAARQGGALGPLEATAAAQAKSSAGTPAVVDYDTLGRSFRSTQDNGAAGEYTTTSVLDINGQVVATIDPLGRTALEQDYTLTGQHVHQASLDAGERWVLLAADNRPVTSWSSRGIRVDRAYDELRRPTTTVVTGAPGAARTAELTTYGESLGNAVARNLLGATYQRFDGAGVSSCEQRDFDGNAATTARQYLSVPSTATDWAAPPALDAEITTQATFDALRRPVALVTPDGSVASTTFNERNLVSGVAVQLAGSAAATSYVSSVTYDAKAQRQSVTYGNGAIADYTYDPDTFRLVHLKATRPAGANPLQDLGYVYDPVGNVTDVSDAAQPTVFFSNQAVTAECAYTYDAIYRLVRATGREHVSAASPQTTSDDSGRVSVPLPADGQAMQRYTESYAYDKVGNLVTVTHAAAIGGWTRAYAYDEPAAPPANNQLTSTTVGATVYRYTWDANGNVASMPHLPAISWDFKDMLQSTASQAVAAGTPPTTCYFYDQDGGRVQKVTLSARGATAAERLYVGPFEVYREFKPTGALRLERQSIRVSDGPGLLCLIETTTVDAAAPASVPSTAVRYQLGNHLGSAVLELDPGAAVISYEEYFPFGSTSFQTGRSAAEVSLKRYRYCGKERDVENGFYYHGKRYYAPWLGRWTSCDPSGHSASPNLYAYCRDNPVVLVDPGGTQDEPADKKADAPPPAPAPAKKGDKPLTWATATTADEKFNVVFAEGSQSAKEAVALIDQWARTGVELSVEDALKFVAALHPERQAHWENALKTADWEAKNRAIIARDKAAARNRVPDMPDDVTLGIDIQAGLSGQGLGPAPKFSFDIAQVTVLPRNSRLWTPYISKTEDIDVAVLKEPGFQASASQQYGSGGWETHVAGGGTVDVVNVATGPVEVAVTASAVVDAQVSGAKDVPGTLAISGVLGAKYTIVGNDESKARLRLYGGVGTGENFKLWGSSTTGFAGVNVGAGLLLELDPKKKTDSK